MKYKFQYTKWERVKLLLLRSVFVTQKSIGIWIFLSVIYSLYIFAAAKSVSIGLVLIIAALLGWMLYLYLINVIEMGIVEVRTEGLFTDNQWEAKLVDGWFGWTCRKTYWYNLQQLKSVRRLGGFLWLDIQIGKKYNMLAAIPIRMFSDKDQCRKMKAMIWEQRNKLASAYPMELPEENRITFPLLLEGMAQVIVEIRTALQSEPVLAEETKRRNTFVYIRAGLYMGIPLMVMSLSLMGGSYIIGLLVFAAVVLLIVICLRTAGNIQTSRTAVLSQISKVGQCDAYLGDAMVSVNEDAAVLAAPMMCCIAPWRTISEMIETNQWIMFLDMHKEMVFPIAKDIAYNERIIEAGISHGLNYIKTEIDTPAIDETEWRQVKEKEKNNKTAIIVSVCVIAVALFFHSIFQFVVLPRHQSESVPYEFRAEDYEDYLPLETQAATLEHLGFTGIPEAVEYLYQEMEDYPPSREWIEGMSYYSLLQELGCPEYDEETWEIAGYSSQTYWFSYDAYDVQGDYIELLEAVDAMAEDAFSIAQIMTDDRKVDWEKETGRLIIRFSLNDQACEYHAKVDHDRLDPGLLAYINKELGKTDIQRRLYYMDSEWDECILFVRDQDWAEQFTVETGKELYTKY